MKKKKISRRQFLKRATEITAGAVAFPYLIPSSALGGSGAVETATAIARRILIFAS
jgi:hypothetical protein